jgi:hypothetical protein
MRILMILCVAFVASTGRAGAANICQTPKLVCTTTMPIGGFCECSAHGATQDGTVVPKPASHRKLNATGAGCGTQAHQPGCK